MGSLCFNIGILSFNNHSNISFESEEGKELDNENKMPLFLPKRTLPNMACFQKKKILRQQYRKRKKKGISVQRKILYHTSK